MNESPPPAGSGFLRVLGQGLSLAAWRRPRSRVVLVEFGAFLAACALALLAFAAQDYGSTVKPAEFFSDAFHQHASYFLVLLIGAWLAARLLRRPALWLTLATLLLLVGIPWTSISLAVAEWLAEAEPLQLNAWRILLAMAGFVAVFRTVGYLAQSTPPARRLGAAVLFCAVLGWPWFWQQSAWFWYPPESGDAAEETTIASVPDPATPAPPAPWLFVPERVMYRQTGLVDSAVQAIRAQTPGKIDLFSVGFAGDGAERVFRNEVEYLDTLMASRFDAADRTLSLINSPATVDRVPLATLTNLRAALAGVGARMDRDEDVLLLFLTSHGSEDHRLSVALDPLPLSQIRPSDLRSALDDAGIKWRVVIVSACYSGGFVDALRDSQTLVITAARADRASFGCGSDSSITWFGKAFLAQALNRTTDFEHGFDLASRQIREWELAQGETPSVPQVAAGWAIHKQLAQWRGGLPDAPPVPFVAAALQSRTGAASSR